MPAFFVKCPPGRRSNEADIFEPQRFNDRRGFAVPACQDCRIPNEEARLVVSGGNARIVRVHQPVRIHPGRYLEGLEEAFVVRERCFSASVGYDAVFARNLLPVSRKDGQISF